MDAHDALVEAVSGNYPLNAIGRNRPGDEWMPLHLCNETGRQLDRRGLLIQRYWEVHRKTPQEMMDWLKASNLVPFLPPPAPCDHAWEFESLGVDGGALSGRGPQRANFFCTKCNAAQRMEILPTALLPDLTKPVHSILRRGRRPK